jgi:hypothetical protein
MDARFIVRRSFTCIIEVLVNGKVIERRVYENSKLVLVHPKPPEK